MPVISIILKLAASYFQEILRALLAQIVVHIRNTFLCIACAFDIWTDEHFLKISQFSDDVMLETFVELTWNNPYGTAVLNIFGSWPPAESLTLPCPPALG